jgi:hypothetical protein
MSELRALVAALLRAGWNQGWRFNRARPVLWRTLLALLFGALALWRLAGQVMLTNPVIPLLTVSLQSALFALVSGFLEGREQLFGHRSAVLVHLSPAPTWSVLGARLLVTLPGRLGSALLLTAATLRILPVPAPLLWAPLLVVASLLSGLGGQLAGYLGLIGWARLSPRTVGLATMIGLIGALVLVWALVWLVATGAPLGLLVALLPRWRNGLLAGLAILILLPGLLLGLLLLLRPSWVGDLYRSTYLALAEAGEAAHRPHRSWLPRPFRSPAWALGVKEWRQFSRNRLNYFRLGALGLVLLAFVTFRGRFPASDLLPLAAGVATAWLVFAEVVGAIVSADEERAGLFIISGLHPMEYLGGKLIGGLPYALLTGALTALIGWGGGLPVGAVVRLGLAAAGIGCGALGALVGPAALGFRAEPSPWLERTDLGFAMREQIPSGLGSWTGFLLSGAISGGAVLLIGVAGQSGLAVVGALLVGFLSLTVGWFHLRSLLLKGQSNSL